MLGKPQPPRQKKGKSPRNNFVYDNKKFFETIYGPEEFFTEDSIPKFSPRFAGYSNSALKPTSYIPIAPQPVKLEHTRKAIEDSQAQRAIKSMTNLPEDSCYVQYLKKMQQQVPQLTIPKKKVIKNTVSARPVVLGPLLPPAEPIQIQTPKAANDNLALFDETDFDTEEYNYKIKSLLEEGPIPAFSMYLQNDGEYEWKQCVVTAINGDSYTIRWSDTGKTKVVHRLAVRLETDDPGRFEQRRELAVQHREETVAAIKQDTYLQTRASENVVLPEPDVMESIIHHLPKKIRSSSLLPEMVQELNNLYSYSNMICEYQEEWKDPEKAKQFEKEGLRPPETSLKKLQGVGKLKKSQLSPIELADVPMLIGANATLMEYMNDNFLTNFAYILPKTIAFNYFFHGLLCAIEDKHHYADTILVPDLNHYLTKIIAYNEKKNDQFVAMMNLRLNASIGNMIINTMNNMTKVIEESKIHFRLHVMNDLETFIPSRSVLEYVGNYYIHMIYNKFNENKIKALSFDLFSTKLLPISLPLLEDSLKNAINNWDNLVRDGFHQIQDYIDDIRITTRNIPLDPLQMCIEILPKDFEPFIKENQMPVVDSQEINLDLVREKLSKCLDDYSRFILKFEPKKKFGSFDTDFTYFFDFILQKKTEFYDYIFKYMNAQTDKQVNLIGGMITKLIESTTCAPDTVEAWYEKHVILEHIMSHIGEIRATLDYLVVMLEFMSDFLFEPKQGFKSAYEIKSNLHKIVLSIDDLNKKDNEEKLKFIELHKKEIADMQKLLVEFQETLLKYNNRNCNLDAVTINKLLLSDKKRFDQLYKTCELYKSRDEKLTLEITEYPYLSTIEEDFNLYLPAWNIAEKLDTEAQEWLGTIFRQLDVAYITNTIVTWEKTIKQLLEDLNSLKTTERHAPYVNKEDNSHPLEATFNQLLERVQYYIMHLPIIKYLCNPWFRARHWAQITEATGIQIGPNDGYTWNWLIETGIEDNIVPLASISKSADNEAKIELAITKMCEDLTSISFKVEKTPQGIKMEDPSTTLLILTKHQQIMQEIFVPPYIQPFISKVKEYEALAANVRQILKQSIETEQRINELTPAMESSDLKAQHSQMTTMFANKVMDFKQFAESFKLSATFHMILSNQATADICNDITEDIIKVKDQLQEVLEGKRKSFPRFRLLSDSQLITVISYSETPSKIANIFSYMYPAMKTAIFEGEQYCLGFESNEGEFFEFVNKVKITPENVENWFKEFDQQITYTLKTLGRKIMQAPISSVEKKAMQYPSQLTTLVFDILFTNNVGKCFAGFENNFTEYARPKLIEQLNMVLDSVKTDLNVCSAAYQKSNSIQISNMIIDLMNHRDTLEEILEKNVGSTQDPVWLSIPKYNIRNMDDFTVDVTIGACSHLYGFEYAGNSFPVVLTKGMCKFFSQMMMCLAGGAFPLACGYAADRKSNYIIQFLNAIGKQPFVYPCHYHTKLERMKEFISNAAECNAYVIFKDIYSLKYEVLSDFATELVAMKENVPTNIFATYTLGGNEQGMHIPEVLKLAFRPVEVANFGYTRRFEVLLAAMGAPSPELAGILALLTKTITKAFMEPLCTTFSFVSLSHLVQSSPIVTNDPCHEIHDRIIKFVTDKFGEDQSAQLIKFIDATFTEKSDIKAELHSLPMHSDPSINDRLNTLHDAIKMHYGVIITGPSLCGKSALIKMYCQYTKQQPVFINPLSLDLHDLYGDEDSGVLSAILQKNDYIIFDGPCDTTWMDSLTLGLIRGRRMYFGDGSMLDLRESTRFIIETCDISRASPSTLAQCGTIYLGTSFIPSKVKIDHFIDKMAHDPNLIEPLTETIVSSRVGVSELVDILRKVIEFFKDYVEEEDAKPLTSCFKCLRSLIYNYYLPSMDATDHAHHTAQELIENIPKLALFAFYWSWAGRVINDQRDQYDIKLTEAAKKYGIDLNGHNISEVFFHSQTNTWIPWTDIRSTGIVGDPVQLIDREPKHLLYDTASLMPVAFLAKELLSRGQSILVATGKDIDQSVLANIIQHMPYIMDHFSPSAYIFPPEANHRDLREMLVSVLPETKGNPKAHSVALRIPLFEVLGFHSNPRSTSSELIRYIINHKSIPSEKGSLNETISGLTFVLCGDEDAIQTRLSGPIFSVAIPQTSEKAQKHAVEGAVSALWGIKQVEVGSVLLDLYKNVKTIFQFSILHLFSVLQRVGIIMVNSGSTKLVDIIAHQCVRVFYDAYHDENILASISVAVRNIGKILETEPEVDVFQIAGRCVLTDVNSTEYRQVACYGDLASKAQHRNPRRQSLIKFTSNVTYQETKEEIAPLRGIPNALRLDILSVAQAITTPKRHIKFYTELPKLSHKLLKKACQITKSVLVEKQLGIPLMKSFHDTFISAGRQKVHHVLFIDADTLTKEDKVLLNLLLRTTNVYGIFSRGELLDLLTDIYEKQGLYVDPFKEDSLETQKNYNALLADFITDCEMFFHFAPVALHPPTKQTNCPYSAVYHPFFGSKEYMESYIENHLMKLDSFHSELTIPLMYIVDTFAKLTDNKLMQKYPYLISAQNLSHIVHDFVIRGNRNYKYLKEKLDMYSELIGINNKLEQFISDQIHKMEDMEKDLVKLKEQIENSSTELERLTQQTEQEMENANREAAHLRVEREKAEKFQREIANELKATNQILEAATQEVKSIRATDIAVIKNMHQPPRGVILVIMALSVVLGQDVNINATTKDELEKIWNTGRLMMSDPGFLKKLTTTVQDNLNPDVLTAIKKITADPNFEPSVIERSSSAAKSISIFIRAIIPYAEAMARHKERIKESDAIQANLEIIQKQTNEAMEKLNKCQREQMEMKERRDQLQKQSEHTEEILLRQRNRIEDNKLIETIVKKHIDHVSEEYEKIQNDAKRCEALSFLTSLFNSIAGPFNDQERDEIFDLIKIDGFSRKDLLLKDEPLIQKWERDEIPMSWHWRENTSYLSPENGRWVVCENAHMVSTNYLKRVVNRQNVHFISANSPTFSEDFVASISTQVGLVIYDFDFIQPNLVVPVVCRARETGKPFVYNGETINVPKDFFVLFSCKELPNLYSLGMDVELLRFEVDGNVNAEQIAHRSFQLLHGKEYTDSIKLDTKIVAMMDTIAETEEKLRTTLVNAGQTIFSNDKIQSDFKVLMQRVEDQRSELERLKEENRHCYDQFEEVHMLSHEIVTEFEKYPVTSSLWKMFEGAFSQHLSIREEDFKETVREIITPYLAAILPEGTRTIEDQKMQSMETIVKNSRSVRPVVIVSRDSSFPFNTLMNIYKQRKMVIATPSNSIRVVAQTLTTGTPVCVICTTQESMIDILGAVSKNLSANFVSGEFRLFICVLGQNIELSSSLLTKVDIVYFDHPSTVESITRATTFGMRKDEILSGIPEIDAEISITNRKLYKSHVHCFENARLSLQCMRIISQKDREQILDFVRDYLYQHGRFDSERVSLKPFAIPCDDSETYVDFANIDPQVFIESQKVAFAISEGKNVGNLVAYLDLEGKDEGQKIGNIEIIGKMEEGHEWSKAPTFSVRHKEEWMQVAPIYKQGRRVSTFYVNNKTPIEIVTLQE